jgi:hypothetical protein
MSAMTFFSRHTTVRRPSCAELLQVDSLEQFILKETTLFGGWFFFGLEADDLE